MQQGEYTVRMQVHQEPETHHGPIDLLPRKSYHGDKFYHLAKFYVLVPEITLSVGLFPRPRGEAIGEVIGQAWEGMRRQEIGQGQAWYFEGMGLLEIWETYLEDRFREEDPTQDPALALLWRGFERFLLDNLSRVRRIITPGWEPIYPEKWPAFLVMMGYRQLRGRAFEKRP